MSDLINARKIRPLHAEFLCVRTRKPKESNSLIYTPDEDMDDAAGTTFTVLRVGPECRELKEGDTVVIKFHRHFFNDFVIYGVSRLRFKSLSPSACI